MIVTAMPDINCRLAKVEERIEHQHTMITESICERRRQNDKVYEMLEEIQKDLSKMKGFSAGVAFVCSVISGAIVFLWDKLAGH